MTELTKEDVEIMAQVFRILAERGRQVREEQAEKEHDDVPDCDAI